MAKLPTIRADVTRYFGAKPLWLTEYGYQTNPPDRLLGVSYALQAAYIGEADLRVWQQSGVTVLIHFLVRDEPSLGGWQSGLFTVGGTPKPAYHAFALPLAAGLAARRERDVVGAGASGLRRARLRAAARGRRRLARRRRHGETGPGGTFIRTVTLPRGTRVRLWAPSVGWASPRSRCPRESTRVDTALRIVHLLAAIVWVGGTIALVFVAVPPVQRLEGEARAPVLREFGRRWRPIGWSSLGVAIVTGALIASRAGAFDTTSTRFDWVLGGQGRARRPARRAARTSTTTCSARGSRARSGRAGRSRFGRF